MIHTPDIPRPDDLTTEGLKNRLNPTTPNTVTFPNNSLPTPTLSKQEKQIQIAICDQFPDMTDLEVLKCYIKRGVD
jgi:hypothetical protein